MKRRKDKNVNRSLTRTLTFFLLVPLLFNLIGNFIGISGHYTFYYYGYNVIAIISRLIENAIFNVGWRIFTLSIISIVASSLMYFLYLKAKKGRVYAFIIGVILYIADFGLVFSPYYFEGKMGVNVSNFIHLTVLLFFVVGLLLKLLMAPGRKGYYDYA
ncbi:MAG: hypothetical protein WC275_02430 [Bacilli bacterium]